MSTRPQIRLVSAATSALRTLRDLAGASVISGVVFGLPLALAAMQEAPVDLAVVSSPDAERVVTLSLPPVAAADAAHADAGTHPTTEPPAAAEPAAEPAPAEPAAAEPAAAGPDEALADAAPTDTDPTLDAPSLETAVAALAVPIQAVDGPPRPVMVDRDTAARIRHARHVQARSTARSRSSRPGRTHTACEDGTDAIVAIGSDRYHVDRELVDLYVHDLKLAQSLASVSWHRDARGKIDGFRIRRIRCGTVLHAAGFRNGDVVHSVNGKRIRTVFGAISAYRKLKKKEQLRVDVTGRKGDKRRLRFEVS